MSSGSPFGPFGSSFAFGSPKSSSFAFGSSFASPKSSFASFPSGPFQDPQGEIIWKEAISEISKRLYSFLSQGWYQVTEAEIIQGMTEGRIPLGFSSQPLWPKAHDQFCQLPDKMRDKEKQLQEAKEEETFLTEQIKNLQEKLKNVSQTRICLQSQITPWEKFREEKLTSFIETTAVYAAAEEKLNHSLDIHLENSSVDELIALDDSELMTFRNIPQPPKISILFNGAGLSHRSIKKLSSVGGEEFSEYEASELAQDYDLSFQEKLMVTELKIMFLENRVPAGIADHKEKCALCSAVTPQEVAYFLQEHEKEFDFNLLEKYDIDGRMFLGLTSRDVRKYFADSSISAKNLISAVSYAKKQHHKD
eukprot:CAMPEP_0117024486 /NCGR_PEP_ID=MMETSP0472-20121206/18182_1 /TAXON_ID=693140 ORGANISM="Tiarina fusus, Strain LIS" /NCGR_SAMPLE_ID=MMETSP0472 /ASSEMBLY_ACC=CAM_ASM_000603 /LENGTH=363 /DNA_ID=CAMNT_0004730935 /DNA_START=22 /DNA_END=1113 /DNA_ORIENTATION=-